MKNEEGKIQKFKLSIVATALIVALLIAGYETHYIISHATIPEQQGHLIRDFLKVVLVALISLRLK